MLNWRLFVERDWQKGFYGLAKLEGCNQLSLLIDRLAYCCDLDPSGGDRFQMEGSQCGET
jgi:hypothetical protein